MLSNMLNLSWGPKRDIVGVSVRTLEVAGYPIKGTERFSGDS